MYKASEPSFSGWWLVGGGKKKARKEVAEDLNHKKIQKPISFFFFFFFQSAEVVSGPQDIKTDTVCQQFNLVNHIVRCPGCLKLSEIIIILLSSETNSIHHIYYVYTICKARFIHPFAFLWIRFLQREESLINK